MGGWVGGWMSDWLGGGWVGGLSYLPSEEPYAHAHKEENGEGVGERDGKRPVGL